MKVKNYTTNTRTRFKRCLCIGLSAAFFACAVPAFAAPVSGQIGVASEYLGKGLGKSDEEPALFGTLRLDADGLYASAFASQAASPRGADAEVIVAAGYAREIQGWAFDGQLMYREMTGETRGVDSAFVEYQADLSRNLTDSVNGRIRVNYSPDTYGAAGAAWWTEAQVTLKLTPADKLSVAYAVRRTENGPDYDAWNLGIKHRFSPAIAGDLRWYDTDGHDLGNKFKGRLVGSLFYTF